MGRDLLFVFNFWCLYTIYMGIGLDCAELYELIDICGLRFEKKYWHHNSITCDLASTIVLHYVHGQVLRTTLCTCSANYSSGNQVDGFTAGCKFSIVKNYTVNMCLGPSLAGNYVCDQHWVDIIEFMYILNLYQIRLFWSTRTFANACLELLGVRWFAICLRDWLEMSTLTTCGE